MKHLLLIPVIALALMMGLVGTASAIEVTVAASDSQAKNTAQYICDSSNDQTEIQAAINQVASSSGGNVILLDGTFIVRGNIDLGIGVNLIGKGASATTLKFVSEGWVQADGTNNLQYLQMTGPTGILISGSHISLTGITVRDYTAKCGAFHIYANNKALSDITFTNCNAIDGWSFGFINAGVGSSNSLTDITYSGCTAINCGRASQFSPWVTGFDLAESTNVNNLLVENCRAEGSWESGFHFEDIPQKTNVILRNCVSIDNGQKKTRETPSYGAGFIGGSSTMQFIDCISESNICGFHLMDGATVIRGEDIGSIYGFRTTDFGGITLTDCWSDQAQQWAFYGIKSHDVIATNFLVTNPVGNPYPAIQAGSSNYPSYNMNIQLRDDQGPIPTVTVSPTLVPPTHQVPGTIQAEDYDLGGEGAGYHDTTPTNLGGAYRSDGVDIETKATGGFALCYIRDGEWARYTLNVISAGAYRADLLVSSPGADCSVTLLQDGTEIGTIQVPQTMNFDTYVHTMLEVPLSAGTRVLTLRFNGDGQNLDLLTLSYQAPAPLPGQTGPPLDPDHDSLFEDMNGNGGLDFSDVALLFNQMDWLDQHGQGSYYDFNNNSRLDFNDVVSLFNRL